MAREESVVSDVAEPGGRFHRNRLLSRAAGLAALVALVVLAVLPLRSGTSNATLLTLTLMLTGIGVAINWNLTGGFCGYVDFGHAVWFGIGAYTTAILMSPQSNGPQVGWPPVPAIVIGALVAGLLAAVIGRATMRLKGPYFSIAMLGTFVAVREIVRVWGGLTGGGVGLTLPPYLNRALFYYVELALVVALVVFTWWLRRTRFGAALVAIREDEIGAETRGIDTTLLKTATFSFAGLSTGLFGALWAYQNTFVDPDIAFVEVRTIDARHGHDARRPGHRCRSDPRRRGAVLATRGAVDEPARLPPAGAGCPADRDRALRPAGSGGADRPEGHDPGGPVGAEGPVVAPGRSGGRGGVACSRRPGGR